MSPPLIYGPLYARRIENYHEDMGQVLWWVKPGHVMPDDWGIGHGEAPFAGRPGDSDWPGYHEWFTPLPCYPELWEEAPPPPPEFEVEMRGGGTFLIRHVATGITSTIWHADRYSLEQYEDFARIAKLRLRAMTATRDCR